MAILFFIVESAWNQTFFNIFFYTHLKNLEKKILLVYFILSLEEPILLGFFFFLLLSYIVCTRIKKIKVTKKQKVHSHS